MSAADHSYRRDIDGLRAVAVLSVVLYHAGVPFLPGGFVGVDIFFVISGFLITRIIAREIQEDRFSLLTFYERRTRRIFPALFAMLGASVVLASFILLPREMEEFGQSLAATTLFGSNIYFWKAADYFAAPAHLKPLLHTWSLAVEEQFYFVLPLLLLVLVRWARRQMIFWLAAVTLLSFALSCWGAAAKPSATFYLLPTRFWELMAGALLAVGAVPIIRSKAYAGCAAAVGLAMIATAVLFYSSATAFPGAAALLPVLGAALIIHAGSTTLESATARVLSLRPMVFIGLVSYSFYLWHWPALTFARIWRSEVLSATDATILVGLSFALAILSWRYIETPFRQRRRAATQVSLFRSGATVMATMLAISAFVHASGGWAQRMDGYQPPVIAGLDRMNLKTCFLNETQSENDWAGEEACSRGSKTAPRVFIWGDSFAAHLMPGLEEQLGADLQTIQFTASSCPPVLDVPVNSRPSCRALNERAFAEVMRLKPDLVLLSARWERYMPRTLNSDDIAATLDRLSKAGFPAVIVGPSPNFDFANPYDYVYRTGRTDARAHITALDLANGTDVFDPASIFCKAGRCRLADAAGFLFYDGGHYSVEGSRLVARALLPHLSQRLASRTASRAN